MSFTFSHWRIESHAGWKQIRETGWTAKHGQRYPMTKSTLRGISLRAGKCLLVEDQVRAGDPVDVLWGMITRAKVKTDGPNAVLEQKGKVLYARILSPSGAVFQTRGADPPPPQHQQPEATKLTVKLPAKVTELTLVVVLSTAKNALQQPFKPLAEWPGQIAE